MIDHETMQRVANAYTSAWNSGSPAAVAEFFAPDGRIVINRGRPWEGRAGVAEMAAGFYADVPDLHLVCDGLRVAGTHVVYLWTFTGTYAATGNPMHVAGWEEWDVDDEYRVTRVSRLVRCRRLRAAGRRSVGGEPTRTRLTRADRVGCQAGFVAFPSNHSVSVSSRCTPSLPTCFESIVSPCLIT